MVAAEQRPGAAGALRDSGRRPEPWSGEAGEAEHHDDDDDHADDVEDAVHARLPFVTREADPGAAWLSGAPAH
jgi:hypothetical protein